MTDTLHPSPKSIPAAGAWHDVLATDDIPVDRGVAVMVGGDVVAVFCLSPVDVDGDFEWYAVSHHEPVSGSPIMARGLVGSADGTVPTVASPLLKERYDLSTGTCLDNPELSLRSYPVSIEDGRVRILVGSS